MLKSLPLLDDPEMLDPYQRHLLYRFLNQASNRQLAGLMLGCIQRIGGSEAIPSLEAFREAKSKSSDPEWRRLADAALLTLPDVRIRVARKLIESRVTQTNEEAEAQRLRLQ